MAPMKMSLADYDLSDSDEEPSAPKRTIIDEDIKEGISLTPEADGRSKKGKSLKRSVSWHDDFAIPYHEDHDINVLPLELLYIDGEPIDKIIGRKGTLKVACGTYTIQIVDAIFLSDANTGGTFKTRVDMIREEPKRQFQSYIFNVMKSNRLPVGQPIFDGRRKVSQLKDFTGEIPLDYFLEEVMEYLSETIFDDMISPDDQDVLFDDKPPDKPPAWRVEQNAGLEVAYADYNQFGDRLYRLKKSLEDPDRMSKVEEIETEHENLKQAYIEYLKSWIQESPAKKKDLLSLRYRLVYLKEAYMMADKDPVRKYLDIPDLDETEVAHILKLEFEQLKDIYKNGMDNIKFFTGSSTDVKDDMDWYYNYVGYQVYFDKDHMRQFWALADGDVKKAILRLPDEIKMTITKTGTLLLNGISREGLYKRVDYRVMK